MRLSHIKFNLGIPSLFIAWKNFFSLKYLADDIFAGATVAFIAIPLSLAIALASGVPPEVGLVTAIVAGVVCAMFGGTPLSVCGPAAAMCILIADVVEKFGVPSLMLIGALAGLMQLLSGILGLGRLGRYVPIPVIAGFTAGIGVIILIGQLPRAFGLMPPAESNIFSVFSHLKMYLHEINGACIFLVVVTITIIRGLPKIFPRFPAILPAVAVVSLITYGFDLTDVPLIGNIPSHLPTPAIPKLTDISMQDLIVNAFFIYLLASLETLLSSSAVDKLAKGEKHDSDQELIGQGLANIVVPMFGGIPVTGVIARSATNVRAGAKTRRSSIIHSLFIVLAIFLAAPLISHIPIAALAGVLFSVAYSMINVREFYDLWKTAKAEAAIYAVTFLTIIFVDLLAGVQAGLVAACLIILIRSTRTYLHISENSEDNVLRLSLDGALTFLSTPRIADLQKTVTVDSQYHTVVMDLSNIQNLDMSGASAVIDFYDYCSAADIKFYIKGLAERFESLFKLCGGNALLGDLYLVSEHQLRNKDATSKPKSSYGRLLHGVQRSYMLRQHDHKRLFDYISNKQDPHTLFFGCSDSRINPSEMTSCDPGELFIVRNIGNFVPQYIPNTPHGEVAAIEFALNSFDITDIVVCGHANCGAMNACKSQASQLPATELGRWIGHLKAQLVGLEALPANELARLNVINQINNLMQYPLVQKKVADKQLSLHGWFYDVEQGIVYEWSNEDQEFKSMVTMDLPENEESNA